jgi:hypothetical protein
VVDFSSDTFDEITLQELSWMIEISIKPMPITGFIYLFLYMLHPNISIMNIVMDD